MRRSCLSSRVLVASALSVPILSLLGACSSTSKAPTQGDPINFGDSGPSPKRDASTVHDSGQHVETGVKVDTGVDTGTRPPFSEAGPMTPCTQRAECASGVCEPLTLLGNDAGNKFDAGVCESAAVQCQCQSPTCNDGVKNGHETGIDCGGDCPPCGVNVGCIKGSDCVSGECGVGFKGAVCTGLTPDGGATEAGVAGCICQAPTCGDGVKNEDETDVDCGGSCPACPTGKTCKVAGDCTGGVCSMPSGSTTFLCSCPAGMTEAETNNSVSYCVDTWEVSYTQYSEFLTGTNQMTIANQPSECSWNKTFVPTNNWPQVGAEAQNPVAYVNWCDAYAYCTSVPGRHLCGAIVNAATGTVAGSPIPLVTPVLDGGTVPANNQLVDEWYNACSDNGQNIYPYANTYMPQWCNGADSPAQRHNGFVEIPPGSAYMGVPFSVVTGFSSCVLDSSCGTQQGILSTVWGGVTPEILQCQLLSPAPGAVAACGEAFGESGCVGGSTTNVIFDLSGNVAEWENSCSAYTMGDGGTKDLCAVRGGSFDSPRGAVGGIDGGGGSTGPAASLVCKSTVYQPPVPRDTTAPDIGFRCCF
jgi:hypothetical protein